MSRGGGREDVLFSDCPELQRKLEDHVKSGSYVDNTLQFQCSHLHLAAPVALRVNNQAALTLTSCPLGLFLFLQWFSITFIHLFGLPEENGILLSFSCLANMC